MLDKVIYNMSTDIFALDSVLPWQRKRFRCSILFSILFYSVITFNLEGHHAKDPESVYIFQDAANTKLLASQPNQSDIFMYHTILAQSPVPPQEYGINQERA